MKIEATIVMENSINKEQIETISKQNLAAGAQYADVAGQVQQELSTIFGNMTQTKDVNGNPSKAYVKSVKVYVDGETEPCNVWPKVGE